MGSRESKVALALASLLAASSARAIPRAELEREQKTLLETRMQLAPPIVLTASSAAVMVLSFNYWFELDRLFSAGAIASGYGGLVSAALALALASAPAIALGVVLIVRQVRARRARSRRLEELERMLRSPAPSRERGREGDPLLRPSPPPLVILEF